MRDRGFTLIEILLTLVIVAVMAGLLVLGLHDNPKQKLQREADDLTALLNLAADEAVLRSIEIGVVINDQGYQFVVFDPEKKQWLPGLERPFGIHTFSAATGVTFALDGEHIDPKTLERIQMLSQRSEDEKLRPTLLLLSSGEITAFTLTLHQGDDQSVAITGDGVNPILVKAD